MGSASSWTRGGQPDPDCPKGHKEYQRRRDEKYWLTWNNVSSVVFDFFKFLIVALNETERELLALPVRQYIEVQTTKNGTRSKVERTRRKIKGRVIFYLFFCSDLSFLKLKKPDKDFLEKVFVETANQTTTYHWQQPNPPLRTHWIIFLLFAFFFYSINV